ncbi:MAG: PD40 domain-containing protein [Bacteroidaceae bacterium]|nr:PD40 domain-containing protein [Bacteroidaceae bacterium]
MKKIIFLLIMAMIAGVGSLQAQKKKASKPKVQQVVERKPKTAEIDSLINAYLFDEAADLIDDEMDSNPAADYAAALKKRQLQADKGSSMLEATQKVVVIDSMVVGREIMLQTICLDGSCGQLLNARQMKELLSLQEMPSGTGFVNDFGDHAIYSQRVKGNGIKLMQTNLFGDKWSTPTPLSGIGDSLSAEGFPFLMADGTTLYFAADDEASLGGYDIYVTRYDAESGEYLKPENIGMPFNSPANEYLMAYDEVNQLGWFVSDRNQPADKVCVYVFIPSESRDTYDDLPDDQLRSLAAMHSIKTRSERLPPR